MEVSLSLKIEGFWLPKDIRTQILSPEVEFSSQSFVSGRPGLPQDEDAITAFWPNLSLKGWHDLLSRLDDNRSRVPVGTEFWDRFRTAMQACGAILGQTKNPLRIKVLDSLPGYTGFSRPMIRSTLGAMQLMSYDSFPAVFQNPPSLISARKWQSWNGLQGRIRFFPNHPGFLYKSFLPKLSDGRLLRHPTNPELVIGFGAGNVPGTALMIAMLGLACTLTENSSPAVLVRNSRQEPLFTPIVLEAIEEVDPDLVCSTAVMVWDYDDTQLQENLLSQADIVIAAASDETISQIEHQVKAYNRKPEVRFHAHGHKVSFAVIGKEIFTPDMKVPSSNVEFLDVVALLSGLDSIYWDQFGCLSARIHFVECPVGAGTSSLEYAQRLVIQLRALAENLPRGSWPRQAIHTRFDRYKQLEITNKVSVFSRYDDDFLLVHDERELTPAAFVEQVNQCQGRVIVIRPVHDLADIPEKYLRWIPSNQLQSLSVAVGRPGGGIDERFLRFAEACGARGVTAIRSVGRGAFPQLAYSWDGLLPLDLVYKRPKGYFTTIEFDRPFDQIIETYRLMLSQEMQQDQ